MTWAPCPHGVRTRGKKDAGVLPDPAPFSPFQTALDFARGTRVCQAVGFAQSGGAWHTRHFRGMQAGRGVVWVPAPSPTPFQDWVSTESSVSEPDVAELSLSTLRSGMSFPSTVPRRLTNHDLGVTCGKTPCALAIARWVGPALSGCQRCHLGASGAPTTAQAELLHSEEVRAKLLLRIRADHLVGESWSAGSLSGGGSLAWARK